MPFLVEMSPIRQVLERRRIGSVLQGLP